MMVTTAMTAILKYCAGGYGLATDACHRMSLREAHDHPWMTAGKAPTSEHLYTTSTPPGMCRMIVLGGMGQCLNNCDGVWGVRWLKAAAGKGWIAISNREPIFWWRIFFPAYQRNCVEDVGILILESIPCHIGFSCAERLDSAHCTQLV